jgi:hypothetical protein
MPPALIRAGIAGLPAAIAVQGERAGRRFIEFFTANIHNRNTRMAYARAGCGRGNNRLTPSAS